MVSVVINTRDRPHVLARCLAALAGQQAERPFEVIVVDDGSLLDLKPVIRSIRRTLSVRLESIPHGGRATARNHGAALATGRRIWFLGDDVFPEAGCLARHIACEDPMTALVGSYPWRDLCGSPPFRRWAEPNPQDQIQDPSNAGFFFFATGNLSIDRTTFERLGGFDERFRRYGWEDIDLGLRLARAGGHIVFDPEARAVHAHPPLNRRALWRREREMGYTALQFWLKWVEAEPATAEQVRFWEDPSRIRPPMRARRLFGETAVAVLDRLAPSSRLNERCYERLIFSYRLEGVAQAHRDSMTRKSNPPAPAKKREPFP